MKKPLFIAAFLLLFANANAFAKTQGNYITINSVKAQSDAFKGKSVRHTVNSGSSNGIGISYLNAIDLNAINIDGVFIAPEVFYEKLNIKAKGTVRNVWNFNDRAGVKLNLGYDINDNIAFIVNTGLAITSYDVRWDLRSVGAGLNTRSDYSSDLIYGAAIKFSPTKNVSIILSHDVSSIDIQEPDVYFAQYNSTYKGEFLETNIGTTKLGLSYNF